ncbi:MAG: tandem-95 repeat protein [Pseudomonadales bacterium]|nr:tandem-95 repeat protein [Pseudomonadales bacterium]
MSNSNAKGNSKNTNGGTETSFQNTPQAKDDAFGTPQSGTLDYQSTVYLLNVMGNDLGGNAKSLWSVDDGVNQSGAMSGHEAGDLLEQDAADVTGIAGNRSAFGASLSVTSSGMVAYDSSTIDAGYAADLTGLALGETMTDSFIYAIRLANGTLSWAKASVVLTGVNDTPVVSDVAVLAVEDGGSVSGAFVGDDVDSDDDGSTLTYSIIGAPAVGTLTNNGDGTFSYDPGSNFQSLAEGETAEQTVTYVATDSHGAISAPATLTITVVGTNDGPTLAAGTLAAAEDGPVVTLDLSALGDDVDSDDTGSSLTYTLLGAAAAGSASISGTTLAFNPGSDFQSLAAGETTTVTLDIEAKDQHGATATNSVEVTVTGVNDAPTVGDVALAATEDGGSVSGAFVGDDVDSDDDGASISYAFSGSAATGTLTNNGDGTFSYDPGSNFQSLAAGETAQISVDYTATDSHSATSTPGTVTITVTGVNDDPTLAAGALAASEDGQAVTLDLSSLGADIDSDDDGSSLSYSLLAPASAGSASVSGNTLNFNPGSDFQSLAAGETTTVTLDIQAEDQHGATASSTVTVTVTGVNDAPVIGGTSDGAVTLLPAAKPFTVEQYTNYTGNIDLNSLRNYAATHTANYTAETAIIDYTDDPAGFAGEIPGSSPWPAAIATNAYGTGGINNYFFARITSTLNITEADTYTFRTFNDDGVYVSVNNQLVINDSGIHAEQAYNGNLTLNPGLYPVEIFFFERGGEASLEFTYKNSSGSFQHVSPASVSDSGVLSFTDVDLSDSHSVSVSAVGSTQGTLTATLATDTTGSGVGGSVNWDYQIDNSAYQSLGAGETTVESFVVSVDDGHGGVAQQQVDITITGGNDGPTANADSASVDEDQSITISVLANDTDPDANDVLTLQSVSTAQHGSVSIVGNDVLYTPTANFAGSDSFTYVVTDTSGATSTATVDVTVNPVNDGPSIQYQRTSISNGSFENSMTGWSYSQINYVGDWQASDGSKLLDMNAEHGGGYVTQNILTVAGQQYTVLFDLSKNPGSPTGTETLQVSKTSGYQIGDVESQLYTYNLNNSTSNMQWTTHSFTFTAYGPDATLRFSGNDSSFNSNDAWGPALDNIRLAADLSAYEDTATTVHGLSISDIDAGSNPITVSLSVANGTLSLSGAGLSGDLNGSDGTLAVTGTLAAINAALASSLVYQGNADYFGADTLSISVNDLGSTGSGGAGTDATTLSINVVPVADTYTLTNLVSNGSFENSMNGWSYSQINYIGDWQAADGSKLLDMNAEHGGGYVEQTLSTIAGQQYTVGFALSKNPGAPTGQETLRVSAAGSSQDYLYNLGNSTSNMQWVKDTFTFTAAGSSTTLRLASADPTGTNDAWGPALDEVLAVTNRVITGFDKALGDTLDLSQLLGSVNAPHDNTAFSGGYLDFDVVGSDTVVYIDADGGGDDYIAVATLIGVSLLTTDTGNYSL